MLRVLRVLKSRLKWERKGRIASGMGDRGATGFRGILSGDGRGTALAPAEDSFLARRTERSSGGSGGVILFVCPHFRATEGCVYQPKDEARERTQNETFFRQNVPFCPIHIGLCGRCDARVVGVSVSAEGRRVTASADNAGTRSAAAAPRIVSFELPTPRAGARACIAPHRHELSSQPPRAGAWGTARCFKRCAP